MIAIPNNNCLFYSDGTDLFYKNVSRQNGIFLKSPDTVDNRITETIDVSVKLTYTKTGSAQFIFGKYNDSLTNVGWCLVIDNSGIVIFYGTDTGLSSGLRQCPSTLELITEGETKWIRVVKTGGTGNFKFYNSTDNITYTLIHEVVYSAMSSTYASTSDYSLGNRINGKLALFSPLYEVEVWNGDRATGTKVIHFKASDFTSGNGNQLTNSVTAEIWTDL